MKLLLTYPNVNHVQYTICRKISNAPINAGLCETMPRLHGKMLGCAEQLPVQLFAYRKHDLTVLVQIAACWKDHCEQMLTIRSTFLYLDRTYVISTSGTRSLFEMGLQLYGQHLQEHPEVLLQHLSLTAHVMASLDIPNTAAHVTSISRTETLFETGLHLHGQHL